MNVSTVNVFYSAKYVTELSLGVELQCSMAEGLNALPPSLKALGPSHCIELWRHWGAYYRLLAQIKERDQLEKEEVKGQTAANVAGHPRQQLGETRGG